jgi:hypothetical protein
VSFNNLQIILCRDFLKSLTAKKNLALSTKELVIQKEKQEQ